MLLPFARPSSHGTPMPMAIPAGHVGPVALPGTGRLVWWTGRVAIGLRHESSRKVSAPSQSADWIQRVLLETASSAAANL